MADKDSSSRKEPSDLFRVEEATPSIAPVDKIVLPPEEALKRRIRRFIAAGIAALIFFLIAHLVLGWIRDARLASALDEAATRAAGAPAGWRRLMLDARRRACLAAIGIDLWRPAPARGWCR